MFTLDHDFSNIYLPTCHITGPEARFISTDEAFTVSLMVPGFSKEELTITFKPQAMSLQSLTIEGSPRDKQAHGFALEPFTKTFTLSSELTPAGADLNNGILTVSFARANPESVKIEIGAGQRQTLMERS